MIRPTLVLDSAQGTWWDQHGKERCSHLGRPSWQAVPRAAGPQLSPNTKQGQGFAGSSPGSCWSWGHHAVPKHLQSEQQCLQAGTGQGQHRDRICTIINFYIISFYKTTALFPPTQGDTTPPREASSSTRVIPDQTDHSSNPSSSFFLTYFTSSFSNLSSLPLSYLTSRPFSPFFFPFADPSLAVLPSYFAALWGKPSALAAGTRLRR